MSITLELLAEAEHFVSAHFAAHLPPDRVFHNLQHTKEVVAAVEEIGQACGVSQTDLNMLKIVAWFHDTGYTEQDQGHELVGSRIALDFLKEKGVPTETLVQVETCILGTKISLEPANLLVQVIRDADLSHLASSRYFEKAVLLREEWALTRKETFSDTDWYKANIDFMERHAFHTPYGQSTLEPKKQENLAELKQRFEQANATSDEGVTPKKKKKKNKEKVPDLTAELKAREKEISKLEAKLEKLKQPGRGVETLFRNTTRTNLDLSGMADNKANIMISINAIIISITISALIGQFDDHPNLIPPTFIMLLVSLITIIFAVLATRPKVTAGKFTREDVKNRKVNLMFFGNYHKMPLKDFEAGIKETMEDQDYLYGSMIKDNYFHGIVLAQKFRLLRISYTVFMFGLILTVIAFAIASIFFGGETAI